MDWDDDALGEGLISVVEQLVNISIVYCKSESVLPETVYAITCGIYNSGQPLRRLNERNVSRHNLLASMSNGQQEE